MEERLAFSAAEAAEALGVSGSTVRRLMAAGKLPYVELGSMRRIARSTLLRFLDPALEEAS